MPASSSALPARSEAMRGLPWPARIEHGLQRRLAGRGLPHADAGGDQQRARRALQYLAQCADHGRVLLAVGGEAAEIVVERSVDHRIGCRRACAQAGQVAQLATLHVGACGTQSLRARVRAGQADDLMACRLQLLAYAAANEAGGAGQEYTHGMPLRWKVGPVSGSTHPVKVVTLYKYSD